MTVWAYLVGQDELVGTLSRVADGRDAMTHAWLFTGPPGSGRSNAALAFAAALECDAAGCGTCESCRLVAAGSHPDVTRVATDGLSIGVDAVRDHVRRAALHPSIGRWQVMVVEDADRLTDQAANALLKSLEEPSPHTVWMLCAPAHQDVIVTVRSRCRQVRTRAPSAQAIAELLARRDGVDPQVADHAARASQGHIGRARHLATDPEARERRRQILALPAGLRDAGDCLAAAGRIEAEAQARATARADDADAHELDTLRESWGVAERGKRPAGYAGALSALARDQDRRRKRVAREAVDTVLLDLLAYCRDVLAVQLGRGTVELVNVDVADLVEESARSWSATQTLARIDAVVSCRAALEANAAPLLALESMMLSLRAPSEVPA